MIEVSDLLAEARTWIGVPFQHQGRARHGVDCIGFAIQSGKGAGVLPNYYEYNVYNRTPTPGAMVAELERLFIRTDKAVAGTLIVCQWYNDPQHVALVGEGPNGLTLIHAVSSLGKVVEHGYDKVWQRVTKHIFALPGVAYGR